MHLSPPMNEFCNMITVANVKDAQKSIKSAFSGISGDEIQRLTNRSLNRALSAARTEGNKAVRELYKLPKADIDNGLFEKKAFGSSMTAYLLASMRTTPMGAFPVTEIRENVMTKKVGTIKTKAGKKTIYGSTRTRLKTTGVIVEIFKGKKKLIKSGSLALKSKGGVNVKAKGTYSSSGFIFDPNGGALSRLKSVSIGSAITNEIIVDKMAKKAEQTFATRFQHELDAKIKSSS